MLLLIICRGMCKKSNSCLSLNEQLWSSRRKMVLPDESEKKFYLTPEEMLPNRHVNSTRFITKIKFFCAVARPVRDK